MKISYNWLQEYIDIKDLSAEQLEEYLTLLGLEVDEIEQTGDLLEGVVVGFVEDCQQHPNADKLRVCQVNLGTETTQIVCGAANVAAGQKVVVATVGSILPVEIAPGKKLKIKKAKLRGEVSEGMICAEDELGLGSDHSGIIVLDDPNNEIVPGTHISKVRDLYFDQVFTVELTPNRPDAACHYGVARDLSARLQKELKFPTIDETLSSEEKSLDGQLKVEIADEDKCHRYLARIIKDVKVQDSPSWLQNYLTAIGLRPINNVVDATNFVLHELGQPLHAFDYNLIESKHIKVQSFDKKVKFTTLDEEEREVPAGSLFICDGDKPIALAGVMGGLNSEVSNDTTTVLLESAYFEAVGIRKTSKALALQTDASYRYERGIDPNITRKAADRCAQLIAEISGGTIVDGLTDVITKQHSPLTVKIRPSFTNRILGTSFTINEIVDVLKRLEFGIQSQGEDEVFVSVPTFRPDVEREIDLVEEVARVYDYNNIPAPEYVRFNKPKPLPLEERFSQKLKTAAVSQRFKEIFTNSLLPEEALEESDKWVHTLNPISKEQAILRPSLIHGFLRTVSYNLNRKIDQLRFFEVGNVIEKSENNSTYIKGFNERTSVGFGICGISQEADWQQKVVKYNLFDLKRAIYAVFASLGISENSFSEKAEGRNLFFVDRQNNVIGSLSEVSKDLLKKYDIKQKAYFAEFEVKALTELANNEVRFKAISKFPTFEFDVAFLVDKNVPSVHLEDVIRKVAGSRLNRVFVFDVYEGENIDADKKSIAYRLEFIDFEKTITTKQVEPVIKKITKLLSKEFGAELRME